MKLVQSTLKQHREGVLRHTHNMKDLEIKEDVYSYLLRVYDVKDDLTKCTLWQMVKDGLFNTLMEEKGLLPF